MYVPTNPSCTCSCLLRAGRSPITSQQAVPEKTFWTTAEWRDRRVGKYSGPHGHLVSIERIHWPHSTQACRGKRHHQLRHPTISSSDYFCRSWGSYIKINQAIIATMPGFLTASALKLPRSPLTKAIWAGWVCSSCRLNGTPRPITQLPSYRRSFSSIPARKTDAAPKPYYVTTPIFYVNAGKR